MSSRRARYIVKQRLFIEFRKRAYGRPRASYGKWTILWRTFEREHAIARRQRESLVGLQQTVVTLRGKVVVNAHGQEV